jgi:hypothetical protein
MKVELVWLEGNVPMVKQWPILGLIRFDEFFELLPIELSAKLKPFQASRFSKKVLASTLIASGDQIAWLPASGQGR